MNESALAALRAIDGVCVDALMDAKEAVTTARKNLDDVETLLRLNVKLARHLHEIHLLTRTQLSEEMGN